MIEQYLKEENVVLNFRETEHEKRHITCGQYAHILNLGHNKLYLYYQVPNSPDSICYAISEDGGLTFNKPKNNYVLKNSLACHNFRAFIDENMNTKTKFKAIGGYHTGPGGMSHQNCNCNKIGMKSRNSNNPVWPKNPTPAFLDNCYHPCHGNGYYIWESDDGINWRTLFDKPVLSAFTKIKGYNSEGYLSGDNCPTIFYDDNINEYILYVRNNVRLGVRQVLFTKSKDLLNWDIPEDIKFDPPFNYNHDNLYYSGVYKYPETNRYIAFSPYFKNIIHDEKGDNRTYHDERTLVMVSKDRKNWIIKDKIFVHDGSNSQWAGHMRAPHVLGFIESPDKKEFWIYVQKDFLTDHNKLYRYSIKKKEFNKIFD